MGGTRPSHWRERVRAAARAHGLDSAELQEAFAETPESERDGLYWRYRSHAAMERYGFGSAEHREALKRQRMADERDERLRNKWKERWKMAFGVLSACLLAAALVHCAMEDEKPQMRGSSYDYMHFRPFMR